MQRPIRFTIVQTGTHEALQAKAQGIYSHLWRMQDEGHVDAGPLETVAT